MESEITQVLGSGIQSGLTQYVVPVVVLGLILFIVSVYKDTIDSIVSAFLFIVGPEMGRGKSMKWRNREGKITKIGLLRTNIRMRDTKLIQRVPNHLLRKEPYEIMPDKDDFEAEERLVSMEGKIQEIYEFIREKKEDGSGSGESGI